MNERGEEKGRKLVEKGGLGGCFLRTVAELSGEEKLLLQEDTGTRKRRRTKAETTERRAAATKEDKSYLQ